MNLRPQDVLLALKVAVHPPAGWTYPAMAAALGLSLSEAHAATRRAVRSGLLLSDRHANHAALLEFLVHGLRYAFVAERGSLTRGMPTAHAAPPLDALISLPQGEAPPVWPDPRGDVRGEALEPLYRSVPEAARRDRRLYAALSLVDAIRCGRARERQAATKLLREMLVT